MFEPFQIQIQQIFKKKLELINHEIFSKISSFNSLMTKSLQNFVVDLDLLFNLLLTKKDVGLKLKVLLFLLFNLKTLVFERGVDFCERNVNIFTYIYVFFYNIT